MYPTGNYGIEFYVGDPDQIGSVRTEDEWNELRSGRLTESHVLFPEYVTGVDLLLLSKAVAEVTNRPEVELVAADSCIAGDQELWAAEILPSDWVQYLASVDDVRVGAVVNSWVRLHLEEYDSHDSEDLYRSTECLECFRRLFSATRICRDTNSELIWIWTH